MTYALKDADAVHALDAVSLEIGAGEAVGILGESGSGKTTLANAIMRMLPANATCSGGEILIDDRDLLKLPETELRSIRGRAIAMIPQDPALCLNPVITVGCQILEVLRAHVPLPNKARNARVLELLMEVGFEHPDKIASAYPHQLSGGQRQRVTIAQAMSCRPSLVIADEPTSKLDATLEGETINLLSEIRRQHRTAFLVITHDPGVLAGWVDRIAVMYAGRIVEIGGTKQVLGKPLPPVHASARATGPFIRTQQKSIAHDRRKRAKSNRCFRWLQVRTALFGTHGAMQSCIPYSLRARV